MMPNKKKVIIGHIVMFILIGIPLTFALGPMVLIGYFAALSIVIPKQLKKHVTPKTMNQKQQVEELITVIQPTTEPKK